MPTIMTINTNPTCQHLFYFPNVQLTKVPVRMTLKCCYYSCLCHLLWQLVPHTKCILCKRSQLGFPLNLLTSHIKLHGLLFSSNTLFIAQDSIICSRLWLCPIYASHSFIHLYFITSHIQGNLSSLSNLSSYLKLSNPGKPLVNSFLHPV